MSAPTPPRAPRRNRRRVVLIGLGLVLALVLVGGVTLPAIIGTAWMRGQILGRINARLAPGRLDVERFEVSWTGPTRLVSLALLAPHGAKVVAAPVAELNQSLGALLFGRQGGSILTLKHAALVLQRDSHGQLDLVDALQTVIAHPDPTRDLTIQVTDGSLLLRAAGLAEPIEAKTADLDLHIPPAPQALTWQLKLGHDGGGTLEARGETNRWTAPNQDPTRANLQLDLEAKQWPIRVQTQGIVATGQLDGSLDLARLNQRWKSLGQLRCNASSLSGPVLAGDSLRPGLVTLVWDAQQTGDGWTVRRLTLDSALGSVRAEGALDANLAVAPAGAEAPRVEGRLDLAALARQIPHALRLRPGLSVDAGAARFVVESPASARNLVRVEATIADLAAHDGDRRLTLHEPATFTAEFNHEGAETSIRQLRARTSFGSATASGRLDDLALTGSMDLGACRRQVADWVDLGRFDGAGRADVSGSYRVVDHQFIARLAVQGHDLRVEGIAATPISRPLATFDLTLTGPAGVSTWPAAWDLALASVTSGGASGRVELRPEADQVRIKARLATDLAELPLVQRAEATLDGSWTSARQVLRCDRLAAQVQTGDPNPLGFVVRGEVDAGAGSARFDPLVEPGTQPQALRLAPPGIRVSGVGGDLASLRMDAALEGEIGVGSNPPERWSGSISAIGDPQGVRFGTKVTTAPADRNHAGSLQIAGRYDQREDRIQLLELEGRSAFGVVSGTGQLNDLAGSRRFALQGQVQPDFAALRAWLAREIEPGATINGSGRPFQLSGTLGGADPLGSITGEVGVNLLAADLYGMKLGPAPLVVRVQGGQIAVDPLSTTLNEGHIRLEPEIVPRDSTGAAVLRLGKNSGVRDAQINDEVSRRVLAFVAPILEGATRASGKVSVDLDRAEFPLTPGRAKSVQVDGQVVFADVVFAPGELANDLLGAIGRRDAVLRLDRPVTLTIADGRVNQSGLAVPIGGLTRIEIAGWVDFDKNLALTASLPVTPAMLGNNALLSDIAAGTTVRVPIHGTLNHPTLDQEAFASNMKDLGKSLLTRGATRGALELLLRLGRPAATSPDAPAPPTPTPTERRALRQERRANRNADPEP